MKASFFAPLLVFLFSIPFTPVAAAGPPGDAGAVARCMQKAMPVAQRKMVLRSVMAQMQGAAAPAWAQAMGALLKYGTGCGLADLPSEQAQAAGKHLGELLVIEAIEHYVSGP